MANRVTFCMDRKTLHARKMPRSMYSSIYNSFRVIRCLSQCVSPKIAILPGLIPSVQSNHFVQSKMQFVQSKIRNCAVQKHKVEDIIVQFTVKNTEKEANLPLSSNAQTLKCCQLVGMCTWNATPNKKIKQK